MNTVYFDSSADDALRRERLYGGQIYVVAPRPSTIALIEHARDMIETAFGGIDPQLAQYEMPVERYVEICAPLKPAFIHNDKTLELTVPTMARIENDEVPYTAGDDEEALKTHAAIHLEGTGFPWDSEANVYIAGHRLGYPNTESWLTFWDLSNVAGGDKIYVTDANGTEYTYNVFKTFVVSPSATQVTDTLPGKNILTLQSCTLPDYGKRLIVQAELTDTSEKAA